MRKTLKKEVSWIYWEWFLFNQIWECYLYHGSGLYISCLMGVHGFMFVHNVLVIYFVLPWYSTHIYIYTYIYITIVRIHIIYMYIIYIVYYIFYILYIMYYIPYVIYYIFIICRFHISHKALLIQLALEHPASMRSAEEHVLRLSAMARWLWLGEPFGKRT